MALRDLAITSLSVRGVRNLVEVDVEPGPRFNVIAGENGQGKTNLLEAVYLLATSKSFRTSKPADLVAFGGENASVKANIVEAGDVRVQSVGLEQGKRHVRIDGKRPASLLAYAVRTPVVVFHPAELSLSLGSGGERRKLLDRIVLFVSPGAAAELESYGRALRTRQRTLETRGTSARDLEQWEDLVVRHGKNVMAARRQGAADLAEATVAAFAQIAAPNAHLAVAYAPSAPEDAEVYRAMLAKNRSLDLRRGAARVGPHRDDLSLRLEGWSARGFASQGQHRAIVLALKSAEVDVIGRARGTRPLLLLDEVSSELDRARTTSLFESLRRHQGQIFLTTTRRELIDTGSGNDGTNRIDFSVSDGVVSRCGPGPVSTRH